MEEDGTLVMRTLYETDMTMKKLAQNIQILRVRVKKFTQVMNQKVKTQKPKVEKLNPKLQGGMSIQLST